MDGNVGPRRGVAGTPDTGPCDERLADCSTGRDRSAILDLNSMPKYVIPSTLVDPEWNNSTVTGGNVANEVSAFSFCRSPW